MAVQKHTLERCIFELAFSSEKQALATQKEIPELLDQQFLTDMERVLDQKVDFCDTVIIDHLELDLGQMNPNDLRSQLTGRILSELDKQVKKVIDQEKQGKTLINKSLDLSESYLEIFVQFLGSGLLPWWAASTSINDLERPILELAGKNPEALTCRLGLVNQNTWVYKRLVSQFSESFLSRLISLLVPEFGLLTSSVHQSLTDRFSQNNRVLSPGQTGHIKGLTKQIIFNQLINNPNTPLQTVEIADKVYNELKLGYAFEDEANKHIDVSREKKDESTFPSRKLEQPMANRRKSDSSKVVYYVQNSGLVLIWPFLESFYNNLGYINVGQFRNPDCHEKAIMISQFLVTGTEEFPEPEMILNKILLGWPIPEPFRRSFKFSAKEKQECLDLLGSVIKHWKVLKGTSIEGLREGFLVRPGKLSVKGEDWILQMERKGIDVLMDQLPWSFSTIKLPWINYLIHTEW